MSRKEELNKKEIELYEQINKIRVEKEKIHQEELAIKKQEVAKHIQKLRESKETIIALTNHDRTSCNDRNYNNGYGSADYGARCQKCHLIEILNGEHEDGEFEVSFDIHIVKTDVY